MLSGLQVRGQSEYIEDELNPEWNAIMYIPVHSIREDLIFEVMDYNDIQKDKSLGLFDFTLRDIVSETKNADGQTIYDALEPIDRYAYIHRSLGVDCGCTNVS